MKFTVPSLFLALSFDAFVNAKPYTRQGAFEFSFTKRQQSSNASLQVDLGYETYDGVFNSTTGLNTWRGVRFAAPPVGELRWQPPQAPASNRSSVIPADSLPPRCPQSGNAPATPVKTGESYWSATEDCLFLSVYSPPDAENLPVFVYIHGGGYGTGSGFYDPSNLISTNGNSFVAVIIQYRLGAFGFLSSDEVQRYGAVNAGILDQHFALQWVNRYISLFGGNSSQVTIAGESAGAGAVMLQAMAYGGTQGETLFSNGIVASPYLPMQYGYADFVPSQAYYAFAQAAGCFSGVSKGGVASSIFQCLVEKDTETLQNASAVLSASGNYGTWGFLPVTDGSFIQELPSQQLLKKKVNGRRILSGNNANEAPSFTPQNITTEEDFIAYLRSVFPLFQDDDIQKVLTYYPSSSSPSNSFTTDFATSGTMAPSALNQSTFGTGQQQRANNLYAETTFVCPSYWLAEAYTTPPNAGYKYQFSVPPAYHAADIAAYFGPAALTPPPSVNLSTSFTRAFNTMWGNFITRNDPSVADDDVVDNANGENPLDPFPPYDSRNAYQLNLNVSDAREVRVATPVVGRMNVTGVDDEGARNDFEVVNAFTWEGGRGMRCDFWKSVGGIVPQ
ncbi:MAG: hypothetical protein M1833_003474 [Piccolia ochrophora]|nr:MAG: hypothetical protein M1833_003474 [Piccolia ochrophora]